MSFMGDKNLDMNLMLLLNDKEIGIVCQVNKYAQKLCSDPIFWRRRLVQKYHITPEKINRILKNFDFLGPQDLYIFINSSRSDGKLLLLWMEEVIDTYSLESSDLSQSDLIVKEMNSNNISSEKIKKLKTDLERTFWLEMSHKYYTISPLTLNENRLLFQKFRPIQKY